MVLLEKLSRLLLPAAQARFDYPLVASDVAQYRLAAHADDSVLDGQTWHDLLLAQYSSVLARDQHLRPAGAAPALLLLL